MYIYKEVITHFKNTINISRTSFDKNKLFQINIVYRIQIEKRVKWYNYVTKKYEKNFFCHLLGEIFFDTWSDKNKQFFFLCLVNIFL